MQAFLNDDRYTVISSANTSTTTSYNLYLEFEVLFDTDRDFIDDNIENQIAEKFKPVLHKHSYDLQQGLANCDNVLVNNSILKGFIASSGTPVYNGDVPPMYWWDGDDVCSFGIGYAGYVIWKLDFDDNIRHAGAPVEADPFIIMSIGVENIIMCNIGIFLRLII